MATVRATIRLALRKLGVLRLTKQADAAQEDEMLGVLNRMVKGWLGCGASHPVATVRVDGAHTLDRDSPSQRLLCSAGGFAVTMPERPVDGARLGVVDVNSAFATSNVTLLRNGMLIEGLAADLVLSSAVNRLWMFRADLGDWKRASDLVITDSLPFPDELDDDIARLLAHHGQALMDAALPPPEAAMVNGSMSKLRARYVKPMPMRPDSAISGLGGANWAGSAQLNSSQDF